MSEDYEHIEVASRAQWRAWLSEHHADRPGVWVVTTKKAAGAATYVPYPALVEEALCFGWVDSVQRTVDDRRSRLLMTPRKPRSGWAATNKERVARLAAAGLLQPAGQAVIDRAVADGSWTMLDAIERGEAPEDLEAALDAVPAARAHWDAFPPSARKAISQWVIQAKRPETRARRIAETVAEATAGRRANQWRPRDQR